MTRIVPAIVLVGVFLALLTIFVFRNGDRIEEVKRGHAYAINALFEKLEGLEKKCSNK